jgi:hypothetical protein
MLLVVLNVAAHAADLTEDRSGLPDTGKPLVIPCENGLETVS